MNKKYLALAGCAVVSFAAGMLFGQSKSDFDRWWTPQLEAITAAPTHHRVIFENDKVRVLEVTVPPKTREQFHVHRYTSALYVISSPSFMREYMEDGSFSDIKGRPDGAVRFLPISPGHALENMDADKPLKAVRFEMKTDR